VQTPRKDECWEAFRIFLEEMDIVVVPGSIFGSRGRHHIRISALGSREDCIEACERIRDHYEKSC
jgi:LL-diaminopimelate aminotransferase